MVVSQTAASLVLIGLTSSILVDCLSLIWQVARRPGRPSPLEGVKVGMSRMIGRLLLAVCVPGSVVAFMLLFMRSWDDNSRFSLLPLLFLCGVGLGVFMTANLRASSSLRYRTATVRQETAPS